MNKNIIILRIRERMLSEHRKYAHQKEMDWAKLAAYKIYSSFINLKTKIMRTEVKLITPHLASIYLERNNVNRILRPPVVASYADQMRRGQWKLTSQGISFDTNNNLVNGQHRLYAVIKSGVSVKMSVTFEEDPEAFKYIDTSKRRTVSDVFYIEDITNANNISAGIGRYVALNRQLESSSTKYTEMKLTSEDMLQIYHSDAEFWSNTTNLAYRCYSNLRLLPPSAITGFMAHLIKTRKHRHEIVERFILELFDIEAHTNQVIPLFRKTIFNAELTLRKISPNHKIALLIKTWNYYITNREVKILRFTPSTDNYPKAI